MKKTNDILIILMIIVNTICMLLSICGKYNSNILVCLSLYLIIFLPRIVRKFSSKVNDLIELIFLLFILFAQLLGSILHFYGIIYWYDSFMHYISGILTSFLAVIILILFNKYDDNDKVFNVIFILSITLMVASLWEIFEFTTDNLLGGDAQRVVATGVTDTMKDIICALLGSILFSFCYLYECLKNKTLLIKEFIKKLI
jgi:uncharacterized membrane protein YjdF|nr:MAG TPA: putative membrane protein [Bacteriophage sp.]